MLRFLFKITHIQPSVMVEFLAPIITYGDTLLELWVKQGDSLPQSYGLLEEIIDKSVLEQHGISLESSAMCLQSNQIQKYKVDSQWDNLALAAAYNNIRAIEFI